MDKRQEGSREVEEEQRLGELNGDITVLDVRKALGKIKNGKAAGQDGLTAEFLKALLAEVVVVLAEILNGVFARGKLLEGWEVSRIFPKYKVREEKLAANYTGVSLLDVGYK